MRSIDLADFTSDPQRGLELALIEELVITDRGLPKFHLTVVDEDEHWEQEILQHPRFITEVEAAKQELRDGKGIPFESIEW